MSQGINYNALANLQYTACQTLHVCNITVIISIYDILVRNYVIMFVCL